MGDHLVDLGALRRAGVAVAVANAVAEVKRCAHFTTRAGGGQGQFAEVVEKLLRAQGLWRKLVAEFLV